MALIEPHVCVEFTVGISKRTAGRASASASVHRWVCVGDRGGRERVLGHHTNEPLPKVMSELTAHTREASLKTAVTALTAASRKLAAVAAHQATRESEIQELCNSVWAIDQKQYTVSGKCGDSQQYTVTHQYTVSARLEPAARADAQGLCFTPLRTPLDSNPWPRSTRPSLARYGGTCASTCSTPRQRSPPH